MRNIISPFSIAGRSIGKDCPPYCIAEVGINHNGDLSLAKRMVDVAREAGADAVKFQTYKAAEFCGDPHQEFTYKSQEQIVTESMLEMFRRYEFNPDQWREIYDYCHSAGITFFSTPQNFSDLKLLIELGVSVVKIGSDDFNNLPLLQEYASVKMPVILSCGMSDLADVYNALDAMGWFEGSQVALMLCTSQYPTPFEDVNIRKLRTLEQAFPGLVVGFSDHTQGSLSVALAVAFGARIFEKHFTLDRNLPGPDHWFSEDPPGLRHWLETIHSAETILGSPYLRPNEKELPMRTLARRSVVALKDIRCGDLLGKNNVGLRRPGDGLPPASIHSFFGLVAMRNIQSGEKLQIGDAKNDAL